VKEKSIYLTPTDMARGYGGRERGLWTLWEKIGRGKRGYANVALGAVKKRPGGEQS
jgi:hypothetical protein